ncbi:IclR family transcriptional regulator [Phreatobacter stygius]|nr:IclR family transcriptional regulator [Phreatobacter stygius]
MPDPDDSGPRSSGTLLRGLEILRSFEPGQGSLSNGDIARATGLPKPTVSRLTKALWEAGYLQYDAGTARYELRPTILGLGFAVLSNIPILPAAHEQMRRLAVLSGCTVSLAYPDDTQMIYVDRCTGDATSYFLGIGSRFETARTSAGRAYVAALSDDMRGHLLDRMERHYGSEWSALRPRIMDAVDQVKTRGFCLVDGEWRRNVRSVAAPIVARDRKAIYVLNCSGGSYSVSIERLEQELGPRVVHICQALMRRP